MKNFMPILVALGLFAVAVEADSSLSLLKRLLAEVQDLQERGLSNLVYNSGTKKVTPHLLICVNGDPATEICPERSPVPSGHEIKITNSNGHVMITETIGVYSVRHANGKLYPPEVSPIDVVDYPAGTYTATACETRASGSPDHCNSKTFTIGQSGNAVG